MSFNLPDLTWAIRAVDEASAVFKKVESSARESMGNVEVSVKKVELTHKQMTDGLRGTITGFIGVATSAFALYNAYDRVQDMQVSISRANLQVKTTTNAAEDAQNRYNETVRKYGLDSEQAIAASKDLQLAQERYSVAVERAQMMQGNLNEVMVQSALSVIPTMITMINSVVGIKKAWATAQAALNVVMNANPIMIIVTAIGLLIAALVTAYYTCEPFRNAVDALGATLYNYLKPAIDVVTGALTWLWKNVVEPIIGGFNALGGAVKGVADWFSGLFNQAAQTSSRIQGMTEDFQELYETVGSPPSTGLIESFETLDKLMKGLETPKIAVSSPSLPPHAVGGSLLSTPGSTAPISLTITGPLVNIEGSADERTAELAAGLVKKELRNVLVEASSGQAAATHKRIRIGELFRVA